MEYLNPILFFLMIWGLAFIIAYRVKLSPSQKDIETWMFKDCMDFSLRMAAGGNHREKNFRVLLGSRSHEEIEQLADQAYQQATMLTLHYVSLKSEDFTFIASACREAWFNYERCAPGRTH